jgi:nitroreductase
VDTYLAIASYRDRRRYDGRPLEPDVADRILDAGRLAGSASNRQRRRFVVAESPAVRAEVQASVYEPANVERAGLVVGILAPDGRMPLFDAGRAAQNMLLAAWNEGVDSCPNGLAHPERAQQALGAGPEETVAIVLSFGYPPSPHDPAARDAAAWSARANRLPLDKVVERR